MGRAIINATFAKSKGGGGNRGGGKKTGGRSCYVSNEWTKKSKGTAPRTSVPHSSCTMVTSKRKRFFEKRTKPQKVKPKRKKAGKKDGRSGDRTFSKRMFTSVGTIVLEKRGRQAEKGKGRGRSRKRVKNGSNCKGRRINVVGASIEELPNP